MTLYTPHPEYQEHNLGGRSEITGEFSLNEAIDLANVLRAGKLPASAEIIQSEIVGPSLGQEAIESGVYSFNRSNLVLLWMVFTTEFLESLPILL